MKIAQVLGLKIDQRLSNLLKDNSSGLGLIKKTTCVGLAALVSLASIPLSAAASVCGFFYIAGIKARQTVRNDQYKANKLADSKALIVKYPYRHDRTNIRQQEVFAKFKENELLKAKMKSAAKISLTAAILGPVALITVVGLGSITNSAKIFNKSCSFLLTL